MLQNPRHGVIFAFQDKDLMRITLRTMGRTDVDWVRDGLGVYLARLGHYVPFELDEIPQLRKAASLSRDQIREKEGELLLGGLAPSDEVILLDERGAQLRSVEFADFLQERLSRGVRRLVFLVGGAYGFSPKVYERADGKLSLSKMTFSHQMVRVFFAEQLYRAFTILKGEPYHNE